MSVAASDKRSTFLSTVDSFRKKTYCWAMKSTQSDTATKHKGWYRVQRKAEKQTWFSQGEANFGSFKKNKVGLFALLLSLSPNRLTMESWCSDLHPQGTPAYCEGEPSQVKNTARAKTGQEQSLKAQSWWGVEPAVDLRHPLFLSTSRDFMVWFSWLPFVLLASGMQGKRCGLFGRLCWIVTYFWK